MSLSSCSIGEIEISECHSKTHTHGKTGLIPITELSRDDIDLIVWRTGIRKSNLKIICLHHQKLYLEKFTTLNPFCANPFGHHDEKIRCKGKVTIDKCKAQDLSSFDISLVPGCKVCSRCSSQLSDILYGNTDNGNLSKSLPNLNAIDPISAEDSVPNEDCAELYNLNYNLTQKMLEGVIGNLPKALEISPIQTHGQQLKSRQAEIKDKLTKLNEKLQFPRFEGAGIISGKLEKLSTIKGLNVEQKAEQYDILMNLIRKKISHSDINEQIQLLTLAPQNCSREVLSEYFDVSEYLVRESREILNRAGILGKVEPKKGRRFPQETIKIVESFYQDDEYTRQMPGRKDYVSVGNQIHVQKRLILSNLKELFAEFKATYPDIKISFSKFCELRPKWCVLADSHGTHSVCVCSIYQNTILLVNALDTQDNYKSLISKLVCSLDNANCMTHRCEKCPGNENLRNYLLETFEGKDQEALIEYKQWERTDRSSLESHSTTLAQYTEILINSIEKLTSHSYTSRAQTSYFKKQKYELDEKTAIVLVDFAENYSFVVQDEVQGFHWNNLQATLHPIVIYYRENGLVINKSFCLISDDTEHDVPTLYLIQQFFTDYLKAKYSHIQKLIYFSDGCAGQNKNKKNFYNLCQHKNDFGIEAEWVFFATSHGKSPCDGIGGTVKRVTARASLQRPKNSHILTPSQMFDFCSTTPSLSSIEFFFLTKCQIDKLRSTSDARYKNIKTIPGTRSYHHFTPFNEMILGAKRISEQLDFNITYDFADQKIRDSGKVDAVYHPSTGDHIACTYDNEWYIGLVEELCVEEGDLRVRFMHPKGPGRPENCFYWPPMVDVCYIPEKDILCSISAPMPSSKSGRKYKLNSLDAKSICTTFERRGSKM